MMNITTIIKKRRLLPVLLSFVAMGMMAVPAKRVKKTLVLADGTTVEAVLTGDENVHYYTAADGPRQTRTSSVWRKMPSWSNVE